MPFDTKVNNLFSNNLKIEDYCFTKLRTQIFDKLKRKKNSRDINRFEFNFGASVFGLLKTSKHLYGLKSISIDCRDASFFIKYLSWGSPNVRSRLAQKSLNFTL